MLRIKLREWYIKQGILSHPKLSPHSTPWSPGRQWASFWGNLQTAWLCTIWQPFIEHLLYARYCGAETKEPPPWCMQKDCMVSLGTEDSSLQTFSELNLSHWASKQSKSFLHSGKFAPLFASDLYLLKWWLRCKELVGGFFQQHPYVLGRNLNQKIYLKFMVKNIYHKTKPWMNSSLLNCSDQASLSLSLSLFLNLGMKFNHVL